MEIDYSNVSEEGDIAWPRNLVPGSRGLSGPMEGSSGEHVVEGMGHEARLPNHINAVLFAKNVTCYHEPGFSRRGEVMRRGNVLILSRVEGGFLSQDPRWSFRNVDHDL